MFLNSKLKYSKDFPQKLNEYTQNSRKKLKTQGKTQNSRKILRFPASLKTIDGRDVHKKAWPIYEEPLVLEGVCKEVVFSNGAGFEPPE